MTVTTALALAAQNLTSQPHLDPLVEDAVAAYCEWEDATATLNACTGTAYEVEDARLAKFDAFMRYQGRLEALAEIAGDWISCDAGIRHLYKARIDLEHALDNPEDYNGLFNPH